MTTPSNPEFDAECIRRILAGEKHLFHDLIRPCERSIYFLLLSLLANEAEAEDVAQETVIKVYLNLHPFRGESQFRTWVLSIARNEGLRRVRKMGNHREDSLMVSTAVHMLCNSATARLAPFTVRNPFTFISTPSQFTCVSRKIRVAQETGEANPLRCLARTFIE